MVDTLRITYNIDDPRIRRHARLVITPTIVGPGTVTLQTLNLEMMVLRKWLCLPSLHSLTLDTVTVEVALPVVYRRHKAVLNSCKTVEFRSYHQL
jgi:hypothetical protein